MKQILNVSRLYSLSSVYTPSLRASSLRSLFVAHYNVQKRNVEHLAAIKELRKATNGGMAECKEALAKFNWVSSNVNILCHTVILPVLP